MSTLPCPPERWAVFSPLIDALQALPATERAGFVESCTELDLRPALRRVLAALAQQEDSFLSHPGAGLGAPLQPGDTLGPYALLRPLGQGGMAEVWLARRADGAFERELALKLPHPELCSPAALQRFVRERDLLARLEHPHIARFYDAGVASDGRPYLALEYVDGQPLTLHCIGLSPRDKVRLLLQACDAVAHAHGLFIAHRDLKPANVLVTPAGQVRLLDFGIATLLATEGGPETTQLRAGTPRYAAPEQRLGLPCSAATDVHALGLLLCELINEQPPLPGPAAPAPLRPPGPAARRGLQDLQAIAARCLAEDPAQRYASAALLGAELRAWLDGRPTLARPIGPWRQLARLLRRHWLATALSLGLLLSLLLGGSLALRQAREAERQARRAELAQQELMSVFLGADPRRADRKPASERTLKELLDGRLQALLKQPTQDAEVLEPWLRKVSNLYAYMGEPVQAAQIEARRIQLMAARGPADPAVLDARLALVWALQGQGDWRAAQAQITELARWLDPPTTSSLQRAELDLARHDQLGAPEAPGGDLKAQRLHWLARARQGYQAHAPGDAGHGAVLMHLGQGALVDGHAAQALELADEALQRAPGPAPQEARLLALRARAHQALGHNEEALQDQLRAAELMRGSIGWSNPGAWDVLAQVLASLCRTDPARALAWNAQVDRLARQRHPTRAALLDQALQRNCPAP
ncbi:serine/threonine protein kinase [Inhella inkyongensis]|uniref:Serine/threonine protein kinase n=1 Tax=Inhella inkyongensis TaxID=392593 RepID=A0A840S6I2_9BURK|nr:serine/threonine-protein kinase [Inhella inkyongensis]MBB5204080.1 serine/threonine protein kinase [Inhella inkyongensis]